MSRLIPDSSDSCRPFAYTESEMAFLTAHPELIKPLHRAATEDVAPFLAALKAMQEDGSITRDFAARLMATFRLCRNRRLLAEYRKKYPKRIIYTPGYFADAD